MTIPKYVVLKNIVIPLVWSEPLAVAINAAMKKGPTKLFSYTSLDGKTIHMTPDAKNLMLVKAMFEADFINETQFVEFYASCIVRAVYS